MDRDLRTLGELEFNDVEWEEKLEMDSILAFRMDQELDMVEYCTTASCQKKQKMDLIPELQLPYGHLDIMEQELKNSKSVTSSTSANSEASVLTSEQSLSTVDKFPRKRKTGLSISTIVPRGSVDSYAWRKYGQKIILNHQYPRSYFKCAQPNCRACKQEEVDGSDNSMLRVTYKGNHTCHHSSGNASFVTWSPSLSLQQENIIEEGASEILQDDESMEAINSDSFEHVEMQPIPLHDAFEDMNKPTTTMSNVECSTLQDTKLSATIVKTTPFLAPDATLIKPTLEIMDGIQLLLKLESKELKSIFVGVVVNAMPSEFLEFFFFNAKDMAICVGVGLPQSKVIMHNDLSITIEETVVSERELQDTWNPLLNDTSCHLVMKNKIEVSSMQVDGEYHVQAFVPESSETLSRLYGVGFDCSSQHVDETYDATEVSWPLLYDMAMFILTTNDVRCHGTEGTSSAQGSGSFQRSNSENNMVHRLQGKHNSLFNHGNLKGDGDNDNGDELEADVDDPPMVLKVTMYPLTKGDILDTHVKPYGLDGACIAPRLVFEFCKNRRCKRISIKTQTRLELASQMDVFYNKNRFGWYHTGIQISLGCEDTEVHPQSRRVALLKHNSCRISNPRESYKYTTTKGLLSSTTNTYTSGGQGTLNVSSALLGGMELQGSSSGSRMQQLARSNGESIDIVSESICGGFFFQDCSSTEFPARANFFLFYPLQNLSIWYDREFLQGQGLFTTIEPCIEGTWIPLNELDASPYLFKVARSLKLHSKGDEHEYVDDYKQEYVLPFYVNHAMSHLKSQRSKHIELFGNQQFVPNVLTVGSVY